MAWWWPSGGGRSEQYLGLAPPGWQTLRPGAIEVMTYAAIEVIAWAMRSITTDYEKEGLVPQ